MKLTKFILIAIAILFAPIGVYAATTQVFNGGTGSSTLTGIIVGNGTSPVNSLTIGTGLNLTGTTLTSTGGSGGVATSSFTATYPIKITTSSSAINFSLLNMATTTASCAGTLSCTAFTIIGTSPITLTGTGLTTDPNWLETAGYLTPTSTIGIIVNASSTIGSGIQAGGLTISGGATTTANAYFASKVGIGTQSPISSLSINEGAFPSFADLTSSGNAYIHFMGTSASGGYIGSISGTYDITDQSGTPGKGITIASGGSIGIATTTPGSLLSLGVSGNASGINFTLATSTFANAGGINITTGCYAIAGTCISGGGGTTYTGTYPIIVTGSVISTPLATTTIQQTYGTAQLGQITLATTSASFNGLTIAEAISNSGGIFTFAPLWSGTLNNTGLTNSTIGITATSPLTGGGTPALGGSTSLGCQTASGSQAGCLSSVDWTTFNNKQASISLTTTGTGAATFVSNVLNIPTPVIPAAANPTGTIGLTAVNGSATTFMRSDAAPLLSQAIIPTWTGLHTFQAGWISQASSTVVGNFTVQAATTTLNSVVTIATTSPVAFQVNNAAGTNILNINDITPNTNNPIFQIQATNTLDTLFQVDQYGHLLASSTPAKPTISSCGTGSPTISSGSNDDAGIITMGTAASACTVTFGAAYSLTPVVVVAGSNTVDFAGVTAQSTTGFTIGLAGSVSGDVINYWVIMP